ncbi:MAG: DUF1499 domain-containing protein [Candidatus Dadabacteria bacterium]|nr:MAG: DUF1499 domain-containing protein [Candidatus Dadabacteria bacterium]
MDETPGQLRPCPRSPNCVSTMADPSDTGHYIEPVSFDGDPAAALAAMATIIEQQKRTKIVERGDLYLHATFTSALFRFVDDVEVLIDPEQRLLHLRSASRVGYSDLGANRKRARMLLDAFVRNGPGRRK